LKAGRPGCQKDKKLESLEAGKLESGDAKRY
jgi:hypothetical protein